MTNINKTQAASLLVAILAVIDQFNTGILPNAGLGDKATTWILLVTTTVSAVLPRLFGGRKGE
jgi:hypothetical protein